MNSVEYSFSTEYLFKLKEYFKAEINSSRRFEEISTVEELYNILEDRDALTDNVLLEVEPNFRKFVQCGRNKVRSPEKLRLPQTVVRLVTENYPDEWEKFALHLKLPTKIISQCQDVEDVLINFVERCEGMSFQEMSFRLIRALEKCDKGSLRKTVVDLMTP